MILSKFLCVIAPMAVIQPQLPGAEKGGFTLTLSLDMSGSLRGYETRWQEKVIEKGEGLFHRGEPVLEKMSAPFLLRGCQDTRQILIAGMGVCAKSDSFLIWTVGEQNSASDNFRIIASATGQRVLETFPFLMTSEFAVSKRIDNYSIGLNCVKSMERSD